jgi:arylmalonate decarboxylase
MPQERVLGMIVPRQVPVPEEAPAMYPHGVNFLVEGVGLVTMTPEGYDSVIDRIVPAALRLKERGAQAIALMGTSLSFYKGAEFNDELRKAIHGATGLPATTMSTAVVEGLRAAGCRRITVATAYNEDVTERLRMFLEECGFDVAVIRGMGIERIGEAGKVAAVVLQKFVVDLFGTVGGCDGILVSCGGFRTLESIDPLERACGVPVISSMPHALWAGVRLLGLNGAAPGFGTLLSRG